MKKHDISTNAMIYLHSNKTASYKSKSQVARDNDFVDIWLNDNRLKLGSVFVLEDLLHEAAHLLAEKRKLCDTSNYHRWHNKHFAKIAEEVGLIVEKNPACGYSIVDISLPTVISIELRSPIVDLDYVLLEEGLITKLTCKLFS